ncbi:hypothetical protein [Paenibacillus etheri]|uniref:Uncharacterized protein n=1 Tax=Paenibacillus etheri TaxID=1306852 RepID=A0A0W1AXQ7_9BACL|nr:hypothetical protein [Paenibacillus etheri]KTD86119.1 hypothetical protein UQ64_16780 [Paenibacillus etheri]
MNWKKVGLLSAAIVLGSVGGFGSIHTNTVAAATSKESTSVYKLFQQYVQKPASLAHARNYLINHIDEVDTWTAIMMTLQLENAQNAHLRAYSEKVYPENVQKAINSVYIKSKSLKYTGLLNAIKDSKVSSVLIEGSNKGYQIMTSEGMYYPTMNYESFKIFKPYISKDIAAYIDIMATETNQPSLSDGAVAISWSDLTNRVLAMESFVTKYPSSNRSTAIQQQLQNATGYLLYGVSNTSVYGDDPQVIDPEVRQAYEAAVKNATGDSRIVTILEKLLKLLDSTHNKFTPEVEKFLNETINSK